jgi:hypothetical protein
MSDLRKGEWIIHQRRQRAVFTRELVVIDEGKIATGATGLRAASATGL